MMKENSRFFLALICLAATPCGSCATITEDVLEILNADEATIEHLWKQHRGNSEFSFLLLDRWAKISPETLLQQDLTW